MATPSDVPLAAGDQTTVVAVLASFEEAGFGPTLFATDDGRVRCTACRADSDPTDLKVEAIRRLEGASDPDDMQAVVAATCPSCDKQGTMVLHYGPGSSAGDADVLMRIGDADEGGGTPVSPTEG